MLIFSGLKATYDVKLVFLNGYCVTTRFVHLHLSAMVSTSFSDATVGIDTITPLSGSVMLPPVQSETFVSQRHEVNPALALNLLSDIQAKVLLWQNQLRQLVQAIHTLHAQGPMVEGWLESTADAKARASSTDATLLRHGDTDALLRYIESIDNNSPEPTPTAATGASQGNDVSADSISAITEYRLCRLDESGQVRSQPCPPEQMGTVSMAIARYQNYKQLLNKKEAIDAKLKQTVDLLTGIRATL